MVMSCIETDHLKPNATPIETVRINLTTKKFIAPKPNYRGSRSWVRSELIIKAAEAG